MAFFYFSLKQKHAVTIFKHNFILFLTLSSMMSVFLKSLSFHHCTVIKILQQDLQIHDASILITPVRRLKILLFQMVPMKSCNNPTQCRALNMIVSERLFCNPKFGVETIQNVSIQYLSPTTCHFLYKSLTLFSIKTRVNTWNQIKQHCI